ncbi:MAG: alpha-ketoacid dehydrogenase subunit beta [Bdellovibrionaceae bacterium]|nr:alpha-ketoacid dehydrogenase subunit beta [Pseudobdellovibrionaceae bacterium]
MANMAQAIRMALHFAEENLELKDIFGQDAGPPLGGVFTCTQGLKTTWNTPLDERGIVSAAIGLGLAGQKCVAEIQFCDYIFNTIDLLKMAGNTAWSTSGKYHLPIVLRTPVGAGIRGSIYHSHSFDAWASRLAGWKVVVPSNPLDAYGLLLSAIKDPNPVMFLEPKALLRVKGEDLIPGEPHDEKTLKQMIDAPLGDRSKWKPNWPKIEEYLVPIGKAKIVKEGEAATIVSYGRTLPICVKVAKDLEAQTGQRVEVIDLRSIYPYDWDCIKTSIRKTGRVLFVNEDTEVTNFGEHLAYRATQDLFYELMARPRVLAGKNLPGIGLHPDLEEASVPYEHQIKEELNELLKEIP